MSMYGMDYLSNEDFKTMLEFVQDTFSHAIASKRLIDKKSRDSFARYLLITRFDQLPRCLVRLDAAVQVKFDDVDLMIVDRFTGNDFFPKEKNLIESLIKSKQTPLFKFAPDIECATNASDMMRALVDLIHSFFISVREPILGDALRSIVKWAELDPRTCNQYCAALEEALNILFISMSKPVPKVLYHDPIWVHSRLLFTSYESLNMKAIFG